MIGWRLRRMGEVLAFRVAWLLPRWLVYFAGIRLWAHATTGEYDTTNASSVSLDLALKRWES